MHFDRFTLLRKPPEPVFSPTVADFDLYAGGRCYPNPGQGAWCIVLINHSTGEGLEEWDTYPQTTNERMDLLSLIRGLSLVPEWKTVRVFVDSRNIYDGMTRWVHVWKDLGWRRPRADRPQTKPLANADLWEKIDSLLSRRDVIVNRSYQQNDEPILAVRQRLRAETSSPS